MNKTDFVASLRIEPLHSRHDRSTFNCGDAGLDDYLRRYARQNDANNIARAFVAVDDADRVFGYYTLSAANVAFEELPARISKRLPRYPVPAALIGKLAINVSAQGKGLGARLLIDALRRIVLASSDVAIKVVLVDALTNETSDFYRRFGFLELDDQPMTLYLPLETIGRLGL